MSIISSTLHGMGRKKHIDDAAMSESKLRRVLTTFDITALGVGATLGAGVYVLTGAVAKETSGPSVVIAFLIAALTSVLSGLCYAEFGARVPKAGSGYVYSYVTVGELCAFVIGWNLILSYIIGAASVARAWTANFDALLGNKIGDYMTSCCSMSTPGLAEYPDFFAFAVIIILTALIAFGVKEFAMVNKVFTVLNIGVIVFVVIAGLTHADIANWNLTPEMMYNMSLEMNITITNTTAEEYGAGGFAPFGFAGLISGTATCFYAFVGFDCIATTGEEAKTPQKSIPLGIVFSLTICCFAYLLISSTLTLMQPYFLLDKAAPLPYAFEYVGMEWAKYPVSVGAICALSTSLLGSMFPMPRIIYAMAIDGLLFKFLATVSEKTQTPVVATFISGTLAGVMAILFDLKELVDLMSIGTLAAYTLVAASVMLLRYQPEKKPALKHVSSIKPDSFVGDEAMLDTSPMTTNGGPYNGRRDSFSVMHIIRPVGSKPTLASSAVVNYATVVTGVSMVLFSVVARIGGEVGWSTGAILFATIFGLVALGASIVIALQPQNQEKLTFKVPFVPYVPIVNMFVNLYLMVSLPGQTWYKLIIWMTAGFAIYFGYGIRHSVEGIDEKSHSNNGDIKYSNKNDEEYAVVAQEEDLLEKESEI